MSGMHCSHMRFRWPFNSAAGIPGKGGHCVSYDLQSKGRAYPPCVYTDDPAFDGPSDKATGRSCGCGKHGCSYRFLENIWKLAGPASLKLDEGALSTLLGSHERQQAGMRERTMFSVMERRVCSQRMGCFNVYEAAREHEEAIDALRGLSALSESCGIGPVVIGDLDHASQDDVFAVVFDHFCFALISERNEKK